LVSLYSLVDICFSESIAPTFLALSEVSTLKFPHGKDGPTIFVGKGWPSIPILLPFFFSSPILPFSMAF
jgi:hypothetical protein